LFLNFNNDLPGKGLRPVLQGALVCMIRGHLENWNSSSFMHSFLF
jgi:hypothetical protein